MSPSSAPPFRATLREVSDAELAARNRAEHRVGVARFRPAIATIAQIRRATYRTATPAHLATWAAHPDERVAVELATHHRGIQHLVPLPGPATAEPLTAYDALVTRALAEAEAEQQRWTMLLDTLYSKWESKADWDRILGRDAPPAEVPPWAAAPLDQLAGWAQHQPHPHELVPLLAFKAAALHRRVWAAAGVVDDDTIGRVLRQRPFVIASAAAVGLSANLRLSAAQRYQLAVWALAIVTPPRTELHGRPETVCMAEVLHAVGDVIAGSPYFLQRFRKAATAGHGLDPSDRAATIALLRNPVMTADGLQELFAAWAPAFFEFRQEWPALRDFLAHRCATPALWRTAAREAVGRGLPAAMLTVPGACRDPEVRATLYRSGDGLTAAGLWANGATAEEFARTFGALARRDALPIQRKAYAGIPQDWWVALQPDDWAPLLTPTRRPGEPYFYATILVRIPDARRDARVWAFVSRRDNPDGLFLEPAIALAADPDAGPEEQRREILLACLAADPERTLAAVVDTMVLLALLDRR
ncbi:MAG TPA: hypothetical protein VMW52_11635, partial [Phycisphaerae bacterium]|nr:hypothetical protein [Phycisphaerae bacterium]